ncbi:hypothetical protein MBEHAL_2666 [Halarchaeum acidiphilum MH1-52-1]|uniref:Uncharacterized protein n=2 Tax=Halarchaeum acidiphilum TaxID=489138 RepID=U2YHE8_9EURY|nr:hypothetical protein MBEHAL_2666 [Halarchaeum acidiphilum MH1-52-1]
MDDRNAESTIEAVLSNTYYEDYVSVLTIWDVLEVVEDTG